MTDAAGILLTLSWSWRSKWGTAAVVLLCCMDEEVACPQNKNGRHGSEDVWRRNISVRSHMLVCCTIRTCCGCVVLSGRSRRFRQLRCMANNYRYSVCTNTKYEYQYHDKLCFVPVSQNSAGSGKRGLWHMESQRAGKQARRVHDWLLQQLLLIVTLAQNCP